MHGMLAGSQRDIISSCLICAKASREAIEVNMSKFYIKHSGWENRLRNGENAF